MLKVGLTGGLACGKTFISTELERLGCRVIHADELGHQVLARGGEAYAPVIALFGASILDADGNILRPLLAELVFRDPGRLAALNTIVHPAVRRKEEELMAAWLEKDPVAIVIVEAAILIEAGAHERFDQLIVAACSEQQQRERARERNPALSDADIAARLSRQMPIEQKRAFADYVIDTSGTKEDTLRQTQEVYRALREHLRQNRLRA